MNHVKKITALLFAFVLLGAGCASVSKPPAPVIPSEKVPSAPAPIDSGSGTEKVTKDVPTIGYVTRHHAAELVNTEIRVPAYMLKNEGGYIIISDEKIDTPNPHDLPVTGDGISTVKPLHEYLFTGTLVYKQLEASNGNLYSLRLSAVPQLLK